MVKHLFPSPGFPCNLNNPYYFRAGTSLCLTFESAAIKQTLACEELCGLRTRHLVIAIIASYIIRITMHALTGPVSPPPITNVGASVTL